MQYGAPLCGDPPSDAGSRHVKSRRLFSRRGIGRNAGRKASNHKRGAESVLRVCGRKQKGTAGVMIKGRYVGDQLGNFVVFVSVAKHLAASRTCGAVNPSLRVCLSGCTASFPRRLLVELLALGYFVCCVEKEPPLYTAQQHHATPQQKQHSPWLPHSARVPAGRVRSFPGQLRVFGRTVGKIPAECISDRRCLPIRALGTSSRRVCVPSR